MEAPAKQSKERRPRNQNKENSPKRVRPKKSDVLDVMIANMEEQFKKKGSKVSVGDYIRLRQFRDERQAEQAKEIRVTWVEPNEKESATET
jgi:hypothetical protein